MPTRCNRWFLLQILLLAQHVLGTTMPIIRSSRVLYRWLLPAPHHIDNLKTKAPNTTGSNHLYNTLELLMMGIVVPETCWASNTICNKNYLLHLVAILFPHINNDARQNHIKFRWFVCSETIVLLLWRSFLFWQYKIWIPHSDDVEVSSLQGCNICRLVNSSRSFEKLKASIIKVKQPKNNFSSSTARYHNVIPFHTIHTVNKAWSGCKINMHIF